MMKMIYLGVLFALAIMVVASTGVIGDKKDKISRRIVTLFCAVNVAVVANGIFVMANAHEIALIFHSIFLASIDWILLLLLRFVYCYTDNDAKVHLWLRPLYFVAAAETISMLLNPLFLHVFELKENYQDSYGKYYSPVEYGGLFHLHLLFCYVLVAWIIAVLFLKIRKTARIYRKKYSSILAVFLAIIVCDAVGLAMNPPIDVSLIFYCVACLMICFFSEFYVPKAMTDKVLSNAVEIAEMGVGCIDISGKCIYVNKRGKDMLYKYKHIVLKEDYTAAEQYFAGWLSRNWNDDCDEMVYTEHFTTDDMTYNYEFVVQRLIDEDGVFLGYFITCIDRTEEMEKNREEHYRATHDLLTGIYNEQYFEQKVTEQIRVAGKPYVMITSDVKDFKLINDLFGTQRGDEILKMHARLFRERAKEDDIYGRLSEDRFAFCMPKERFKESLFVDAMNELVDTFANDYFRVQIYMGVYEISDVSEPVFMMVDKCNLAIRTIRGDYSKQIAYFDEELLQEELAKNQVINDFEGALNRGEIKMFLQPQTNAKGELLGAEALARWVQPPNAMITPDSFIPILEQAGLIYKLDLFVWELAVRQLALWQAKGWEKLHISVNISVQDQYHVDVAQILKGLVEKYHVNPGRLKLEITETMVAEEVENHRTMLKDLQEYGFQIEIDDFGSGYSSLNVLKDIKADVIKIDMGFLQETVNEQRSLEILRSLIHLIKRLDMGVITEGVETEEQLHQLEEMGCEMFQGFYFSRPISVSDFEAKYQI